MGKKPNHFFVVLTLLAALSLAGTNPFGPGTATPSASPFRLFEKSNPDDPPEERRQTPAKRKSAAIERAPEQARSGGSTRIPHPARAPGQIIRWVAQDSVGRVLRVRSAPSSPLRSAFSNSSPRSPPDGSSLQ